MKFFAALLGFSFLLGSCGKEKAELTPVVEISTGGEQQANEPQPSKPVAAETDVATPAEEAEQQLQAWERLDTPVEADVVVPWTEAADHLKQTIGVEGVIVDTYNSGRACFLNFTKQWQGEFYVAILGSNLNAFDEAPEKKFLNQRVRVVGKVKMYKGRPQIVVETPEHIQILPPK